MSAGETVNVGTMELASDPGWVIHDAVVCGSFVEPVRVGETILVSALGLLTSEVTISGTPGETVGVGTAKLTSCSELVAIGDMLSGSLWETVRVVLETAGLVPTRWVTLESEVSSGLVRETVRVAPAELVSFPELRTSAGVLSDPVLNIDVVVLEIAMLVSVPGWVSKEAVISRASGETSGVVMVTPVVLVLAVLPGVLRRVNFPTVAVETLAVIIAVPVVSALSVPLAGSPVNGG